MPIFVALHIVSHVYFNYHSLTYQPSLIAINIIVQSPILASEVLIVEKALHPGNWEAYWFAELDVVGTDPLNPQNATENESVVTRHSAVRSFEIVGKHISRYPSCEIFAHSLR